MKLGEGGEAFFVFETSADIPESLQTSPIISPTTSPNGIAAQNPNGATLQEPDYLDLGGGTTKRRPSAAILQQSGVPALSAALRAQSDLGMFKKANVPTPSDAFREHHTTVYLTSRRVPKTGFDAWATTAADRASGSRTLYV